MEIGVSYSGNITQTKTLIAIHHSFSPKDSTRDSLDLLPKNQNKKRNVKNTQRPRNDIKSIYMQNVCQSAHESMFLIKSSREKLAIQSQFEYGKSSIHN